MKALLPLLILASTLTPLAAETVAERDARMQWFREARFGMFIHWGVYSVPAGMWKGKPVKGIAEWVQSRAQIPVAEYTPLKDQFNPVKYDADAWVSLAKQAGMKYIVITSKHHDGFCLWDSDQTDWDIASTPYKKDLLKQLAAACKKHELKLCFYHSIMDWHHPDWGDKKPWRGNHDNPSPDMDKYTAYMKAQLKELLTNYGEIGILWFDGEWEKAWTHERGLDLYDYCRELQPNIIVNNRVDKGRKGMEGLNKEGDFAGDYGTPEQEIPHQGIPGLDWESCMTMNDTWGYSSRDQNWKSNEKLIRNLIDIASKGGNYLLNVGPTAEGEIPGPSIERLEAVGKWMKVNRQSIHGTSANTFKETPWGRSTTKKLGENATTRYLHIFNWPADGKLTVPGIGGKILALKMLGSPDVKIGAETVGKDLVLTLPKKAPDPIATVVGIDVMGAPQK